MIATAALVMGLLGTFALPAMAVHGGTAPVDNGSCAEQVVGQTGGDAVAHLATCSPGGLP